MYILYVYLKEVKQIPSSLLQSLLVLIYMYHHIISGLLHKRLHYLNKKIVIAIRVKSEFRLLLLLGFFPNNATSVFFN